MFCLFVLETGIAIQPVFRAEDKTKIDDFMRLAPDDLRDLQSIGMIGLNRNDEEYWNDGVGKIYQRFMKVSKELAERKRRESVGATTFQEMVDLPQVVYDKLDSPALKLEPSGSIECLTACIAYGKEHAERALGLECMILLGNTGAGKSTFANYLHGCTMESVRKSVVGINEFGNIIRIHPNSSKDELMKIGHLKKSETFIPSVEETDAFGGGQRAIVDW